LSATGGPDPDSQRADSAARWQRSAAGWGRRADDVREFGMPVSAWMIDHAELGPGQRVLELAAGPGDTGFLAAELIRPAGTLVCSDASESMLKIAKARAGEQGIDNIEFLELELEWIDLPTASVDKILCRWGIMLVVDPAAAGHEARRVIRPGGRLVAAVWDQSRHNPWATIPGRALLELGHTERPDPDAPGMFALAAPGRLVELLESAGFVDVQVEAVEIARPAPSVDAYIAETLDLSGVFSGVIDQLSDSERDRVVDKIAQLAEPFAQPDGSLRFPGRSLVVAAGA
jgi:SAM-dependent methyltransferase